MFEPFGDLYKQVVPFTDMHGKAHNVVIYTTIARAEARKGDLAGAREHGKHAAKNVGISIVRAGRELDMDEGQVTQHDPVERWWGMEIQFPPALDEVFGVTNNKQAAVILREVLNHKDVSNRDDESMSDFEEFAQLRPLWEKVRATLRSVRNALGQQTHGVRTAITPDKPESVDFATKAIEQRIKDGRIAQSDQVLDTNPRQRIDQLAKEIEKSGTSPQVAVQQATEIVQQHRRVNIKVEPLDSSVVFSVRDVIGVLNLTLNSNHPAYTLLFEMLDDSQSSRYSEAERIRRTKIALEMLLISWARMEDEARHDVRLEDQLRRTREAWGTMARDFLATLKER